MNRCVHVYVQTGRCGTSCYDSCHCNDRPPVHAAPTSQTTLLSADQARRLHLLPASHAVVQVRGLQCVSIPVFAPPGLPCSVSHARRLLSHVTCLCCHVLQVFLPRCSCTCTWLLTVKDVSVLAGPAVSSAFDQRKTLSTDPATTSCPAAPATLSIAIRAISNIKKTKVRQAVHRSGIHPKLLSRACFPSGSRQANSAKQSRRPGSLQLSHLAAAAACPTIVEGSAAAPSPFCGRDGNLTEPALCHTIPQPPAHAQRGDRLHTLTLASVPSQI